MVITETKDTHVETHKNSADFLNILHGKLLFPKDNKHIM